MIYKINPQTQQIIEFSNIGGDIALWQDTTEEEIQVYELEKLRKQKLKELERFYALSELWTFTVKDNEGNSLTREQNWFLSRITKNIFLISNKGKEVSKTIEDPESVREKLNNIGIIILKKKIEVIVKIQNAKTVAGLEKIDIQKEFEVINKEIIITSY